MTLTEGELLASFCVLAASLGCFSLAVAEVYYDDRDGIVRVLSSGECNNKDIIR